MTTVYTSVSPDSQTTAPSENNYEFDYGDVYMYPGYSFERPVYLYVWEILVLLTFLQNILIISVFMRRKMRNPTNIVLSAIAVSDSLTGLVTLPTYIMVFQRYDPFSYEEDYINLPLDYDTDNSVISNTTPFASNYVMNLMTVITSTSFQGITSNSTEPLDPVSYTPATISPVDGYTLSEDLCQSFMISKYFLSKSFHTVSIFLTLFLETQRYVSMAYPYRYNQCFNRLKVVSLYCILTFLLSPILHAFHLFRNKAEAGLCQWSLSGRGCGKDCIYLWISFIIRHFIPCVTLVIFTVLFVQELRKGEENFRRTDSSSLQYSRRVSENRRISFIVTTVVVVRLIPEIPYSIFLLFNSIDVSMNKGRQIDLETNRIFHLCYELCLICSFLAHFYIYILFNSTFRKRLYETFIQPVHIKFSNSVSFHSFPSWFSTKKTASVKSKSVKTQDETPVNYLQSNKTNIPEKHEIREGMIKFPGETDTAAEKDTENITEMPLTNNCVNDNHEIIA